MDDIYRYTWKTMFLAMLFMCMGIFLCSSVAVVAIDGACARESTAWIPVYPDSEVLSESFTFIRPFGIGITRMQLQTPDSANAVRAWYREQRLKNPPNSANLATTRFNVSDDDNGGSFINLYAECAQ